MSVIVSENYKNKVEIIYDFVYHQVMEETNITPTSKQQFAYKLLRARILDGTYSPGYRIVIDQIAKEIATSAIPVREAIRQLESDGLIQYKPYSGAVVTPINEDEYLEALSVLAVLEGYATAISAKYIPEERIIELQEINNKMERALEELDFISFGKFNRMFHVLTYEHCDNKFLVENIRATQSRLDSIRRAGSAFIPIRARESVKEHNQILQMIKSKQPFDKIEAFVRSHKLNTLQAFIDRKTRKDTI